MHELLSLHVIYNFIYNILSRVCCNSLLCFIHNWTCSILVVADMSCVLILINPLLVLFIYHNAPYLRILCLVRQNSTMGHQWYILHSSGHYIAHNMYIMAYMAISQHHNTWHTDEILYNEQMWPYWDIIIWLHQHIVYIAQNYTSEKTDK